MAFKETKIYTLDAQKRFPFGGYFGFSLIEVMVAVALFSVVMVVAIGALLSMLDANRKAQAIQSVVNNLSFAMESLSRTARVGGTYYCHPGSANPAPVPGNAISMPKDCAGGGTLLAFEKYAGDPNDVGDQVIFRLNGTRLERSIDGGSNFVPLTSSESKIDNLRFYVIGSELGDSLQPRILVIVEGTAGILERTKTRFHLQTTITQRVPDIP